MKKKERRKKVNQMKAEFWEERGRLTRVFGRAVVGSESAFDHEVLMTWVWSLMLLRNYWTVSQMGPNW